MGARWPRSEPVFHDRASESQQPCHRGPVYAVMLVARADPRARAGAGRRRFCGAGRGAAGSAATGLLRGRGGGPPGRAPWSRTVCSCVSGFGRTRSSSRVCGSRNVSVAGSVRTMTGRPPRISAASTCRPARPTRPLLLTARSTSIAAPSSGGGSGRLAVRWDAHAAQLIRGVAWGPARVVFARPVRLAHRGGRLVAREDRFGFRRRA
jgi:hypothetical protein